MQYCERDCEEDEFEGHSLFFSFCSFSFWRTTVGVEFRELAVVGEEEEEDLGLR